MKSIVKANIHVQSRAIMILQEALESYLVTFFEHANQCAIHANRELSRVINIPLIEKSPLKVISCMIFSQFLTTTTDLRITAVIPKILV
jgi:hypothetical protein